MNLFILALVSLVSLGLQGTFSNPETWYEWTGSVTPSTCRPANDEELIKSGVGPHGKASTFQIGGFNVCERNVFEYGDRNSFYSFIADHAGHRADEVAIKIASMTDAHGKKAGTEKIIVEVATDTPQLGAKVESIFQTALVEHAPQFIVLRHRASEDEAVLRVVIRRLDDPVHAIGASLLRGHGPNQEWMEL